MRLVTATVGLPALATIHAHLVAQTRSVSSDERALPEHNSRL